VLKGLNPLLTPDILYALCAMGHGDEVVIVDAHYPADVAARSTVYGKLLRYGRRCPDSARHWTRNGGWRRLSDNLVHRQFQREE
jgi:L-fucose mutarotase